MILVTGANGVVGIPLCEKLTQNGEEFQTVSRKQGQGNSIQVDLEQDWTAESRRRLQGLQSLVHCAPLWLLPAHMSMLLEQGLKRVIAFSSTSAVSKLDSSSEAEHLLAEKLLNAERALQDFCQRNDIHLTLFRPSMIYGYGRDNNVVHIAQFIDKYGFAVIAGSATGLRQPVHTDDLVDAVVRCLHLSQSYGKTYTLAGGETLTYRQMVEQIFRALGKSPRIISLPTGIVRLLLRLAATIRRFAYTAEMADRMNVDLVYDFAEASRDFGFAPRSFEINADRDLGVTE